MILNEQYLVEAIELLKSMIAIPSFSREEDEIASMIDKKLCSWGYQPTRSGNNIWLKSRNWDEMKPIVLLNSHIDTVRPANEWSFDPFNPIDENGKITGLGSNDAGASVVALLAAFRHLEIVDQPCNFIFCASAEEEVSGLNGIVSVLGQFGKIDLAVVGEPTGMQMAIAEKGLLVLDCEAKGKAGHAARNEGENAIYKAIKDIEILKDYRFPLESEFLGPVKMTVTQIEAGLQHNVVPDSCHFVTDVRTNEFYSNEEAFKIISGLVSSEVKARSFRLNSSGIKPEHPLVKRGLSMGLKTYGSPTTSDQAVIPYPSIKIGPGDSARSHTADEFIFEYEIRDGIAVYLRLLDQLVF